MHLVASPCISVASPSHLRRISVHLQVIELRDDFSKRTAEAEALKVSLAQAEETLSSAQTLLEKLSGEPPPVE